MKIEYLEEKNAAQIKKYGSIVGMDMEGSPDLQHATNDAYMAIAHYDMDQEVKYINVKGTNQKTSETSEIQHRDKKVDDAVERWMTEAEEKTIKLVDDHWDKIEQLSTLLLDKELMYEEDLKNL